jgi:glyoxylase-like metal-dependent hydrolase (beta-lactamase superfamily II)
MTNGVPVGYDPIKITDEIWQVGGSALTSMEDGAIYLINVRGHAALVDAGCGRSLERLFRNIQECGVDPAGIEYLLITHCHFDHTGGARAVREKTDCQVVAHELDARFLEQGNDRVTAAKWYDASMGCLPIDVKLVGEREDLELGGRNIEAIHVPGHSPGSLVYLTVSGGLKVLFGQDVHGPLDASLLSDRPAYVRSLNLLLSLEADILCEGHYGVFKGKEEVADFIESFLTA